MRSSAVVIPSPSQPILPENGVFAQSMLKLFRARTHAHEASKIWELGVERHYKAATGETVELPYDIWEFLASPPVFVETALSIGDCIRNLRSSLDYLVSEMARSVGLPDNQTIFPFAVDRSNLEASFNAPVEGDKHRKGRKAGAIFELSKHYPRLKSIISKKIQPYDAKNGANVSGDLLRRVITSDNFDKHRLMIPAIDSTQNVIMKFTDGSVIKGGTLIGAPFRPDRGHFLRKDSFFSVDMVFEAPDGLAGLPVTATLANACDLVDKIIQIFRSTFARDVARFSRAKR